MEKTRIYKIKEPNLIGQIGEVVAAYILEQLYPKPHYRIIKSHTYPYYSLPPVREILGGADFEITYSNERMLVDVKTTLSKNFRISGARNRRYLKEQLHRYKQIADNAQIKVLKISLADFPEIRYILEDIDVMPK